jgi:hypothetical protein
VLDSNFEFFINRFEKLFQCFKNIFVFLLRLQADSGCKIQMAQDSAGMPDRQCTLTGPPTAIA